MSTKRAKKQRSRPGGVSAFFANVVGLHRLGPIGTALLVAAPVTAAALFYVWTHIHSMRLGYALSKTGETHRSLVEQNRALELDVAALRAPERLQRMAKKYGLEAPRPEQVIRVEGDGSTGARP